MTEQITRFRDKYRDFSNFGGVLNLSAEHIFQMLKATNWEDMLHVLAAKTPKEAKARGNQIQCRPDWDDIRVDVMWYIIQIKFAPGTRCAILLLSTGDAELIEGNTWGDRFWGAEWDKDFEWVGQNYLGKLLMEWRDELREMET